MIKSEQIPDEVVEAAAIDLCRALGNDPDEVQQDADGNTWPLWWEFLKPARAAIAAGLAAWPGAETWTDNKPDRLILPLPQEARDGD